MSGPRPSWLAMSPAEREAWKRRERDRDDECPPVYATGPVQLAATPWVDVDGRRQVGTTRAAKRHPGAE